MPSDNQTQKEEDIVECVRCDVKEDSELMHDMGPYYYCDICYDDMCVPWNK